MLSKKSFLDQFRSFYKDHKPNNFEESVEKFTIFGGINWGDIDTSKSSAELIESLILPDFRFIRNDVTELTTGMPLHHSILTGVAMGDGKPHTAFKRANVSKEVGENALDEIIDTGIIRLEKSKKIFTSWAQSEAVSNKLYFTSPFLRFWFAFVSPLFKGIRDGDYKEIRERFANRESEFYQLTFTQLSHELIKLSFKDDPIVEVGSYWDNDVEIDIYAKTTSGKIIAGTTKYTNAKVKKSELSRLQEMCEKTGMKADIFVIVSKRGFSNELKALKGENLKLFTVKNFKKLIE